MTINSSSASAAEAAETPDESESKEKPPERQTNPQGRVPLVHECKTVLITGGSGFIGSAIAKSLRREYRVISLDRKPPRHPLAGVRFIQMDIDSDESVRAAFTTIGDDLGRDLGAVVHLAAYYSFSDKTSPMYERITVRGTERLLEALQAFSFDRFIFSSTMLVHAPVAPGKVVHEDSPISPRWAYPRSKVDAEHRIRETLKDRRWALLRIAGVYDDWCHSIPIAHQIQRIYERQLTGHFYPADTNRGQAFVHLDDLADAIHRLVDRGASLPDHLTLLLGEPDTFSYGEVQEEIGCLLFGRKWQTRRIPSPLAKVGAWAQDRLPASAPFIKPWMIDLANDHYALDISKARDLLGWRPRHRLLDTLPDMIERLRRDPRRWYHDNKLYPPVNAKELVRRAAPWLAPLSIAGAAAWLGYHRKQIRKNHIGAGRQ